MKGIIVAVTLVLFTGCARLETAEHELDKLIGLGRDYLKEHCEVKATKEEVLAKCTRKPNRNPTK